MWYLLVVMCLLWSAAFGAPPLVIAHRGASGYLPEHTLEAAAFAYAQGADFIEQDLVMSEDDVLVVCHDIHLDTTTDVATRYPERKRSDGRFYVVDFTWAELRELQVRERFDPRTGAPVFGRRFPHNSAAFRLCTMEESLRVVQGLNRSTGRRVGVYPEIKHPAFHAREGKDPGRALLSLLARFGYEDASDAVMVQCFDPAELKRLRFELHTRLRLIQLIDSDDAEGTASLAPDGLKRIASYAQGIGPPLSAIVSPAGAVISRGIGMVRDAHALGLVVHPYTARADALPPGVRDIGSLLELLFKVARVDGLFIDHPDAAVRWRAEPE